MTNFRGDDCAREVRDSAQPGGGGGGADASERGGDGLASRWAPDAQGAHEEATGHLQCSFAACLPNQVVIVGETGIITVNRPPQAPDTYTLVQRQGEAMDPMLLKATSTTVTTPLDPPHIGLAPGCNFVGSQGFVYEAVAVQDAIGKGLTEHPEMPLSETLAMAKVFDQIRAQIGLRYPWDDEVEGGGGKRQRRS